MATISERLRKHAYRVMSETATMQSGYGVATEQADRQDMEYILDEAADTIDALVAALEAAQGRLDPFVETEALMRQIYAALALATQPKE